MTDAGGEIAFFYEETSLYLRENPFCAPIAAAVAAHLKRHGYGMRILDPRFLFTVDPQGALALGPGRLNGFRGGLFLSAKSLALARGLRQHLPVVNLLPDYPLAEPPAVRQDDKDIGRLAAAEFRRVGRKRLAVICGAEPDGFTAEPYHHRVEAFTEQARSAGAQVTVLASPFVHLPHTDGRAVSLMLGEHAAQRLLQAGTVLDGIFAVNDYIAKGVIDTFAAAGIRIPEQVAVIGCDNLEPPATLGITSVHVPKDEIGKRGAALLLAVLGGARGASEVLPPEIIRRASTPPEEV